MKSRMQSSARFGAALLAITLFSRIICANPVLVPGIWKNITPPYDGPTTSISSVSIDPSHPSTLYAAVGGLQKQGLWKTTDGGSSWVRLGTGDDPNIYDKTTPYQWDAIFIPVDPNDSKHLYVTVGVTGNDQGFWVSTDGGQIWNMPQAFPPASLPTDVTAMAVDPTDFKHVLVGTHACCESIVYETTDGGTTWNYSKPGFGGGSFGLGFLYNPSTSQGDRSTWYAIADHRTRTTDAGAHWTTVSSIGGVHGQAETYYTSAGVLYSGGGSLCRSTDNGMTWATINASGSVFYSVCGDGKNLYACAEGSSTNYITSPESDGLNWTPYNGGTQKFSRSALQIRFDPVNRIMYATHWDAGLWALKVIDPITSVVSRNSITARRTAPIKSVVKIRQSGVNVLTATGRFYDVNGRNIQAR